MNFLNKMERKCGRFTIRNLTKYIILLYVIGYVLLFSGQRYRNSFQRLSDAESCPHSARTDMETCELAFDPAFQS